MHNDGMLHNGPESPRHPTQVDLLENTSGTFVCWSDVSGHTPTRDEIISRLRQYGLPTLLLNLSRVMISSERREEKADEHRTVRDQRVLTGLLGAAGAALVQAQVIARRAVRGESTSNDVYFHPRQILTAMKLALLSVDDVEPHEPPTHQPLLEALLMINDILDADIEADDFSTVEGKQRAAAWEFAQAVLSNAQRHPQGHVRTLHWFIEPSQDAASRARFDIAAGVERATGLPPLDAYAAVTALNADWLTRKHADLTDGRVLHNKRTYLTGLSGMDAAMRERWYRLGTTTLADLQQRVRERYASGDRHFDFYPFERTPLVEIGDGVLVLSTALLEQLGTASVYHRLLQGAHFSKSEIAAFQGEFGRVLEQYVVAGIKRMAGDRFIDEQALLNLVTADGQKVCDAVVRIGPCAVVFEVKATRALLSARHGHGYDALVDTWQKPVERASAQLAAFAAHVRANTFASIGLGARDITRIYPVVVTYDHVALPHTYTQVCMPVVTKSALGPEIASGFVMRPAFMTVKDVEMLESLVERGHGLVHLLHQLVSVPGGAVPPLWQYILSELPGAQTFSQWHRAEYERLHGMVKQRLLELGLPR